MGSQDRDPFSLLIRTRHLRDEALRRALGAASRSACRLLGAAGRWVAAGIRAAVAAVIVWHRRRTALAELHRLDRRTLKDIGLNNGDFWRIADAYAHRQPLHRAPSAEDKSITCGEIF